jgi:1-deoxy-D-xylulose-5-phosphate reductoisomerase
VAVEAFLKSRIPFTAIPILIEQVMEAIEPKDIFTLEDVLIVDSLARKAAYAWINSEGIDS